MDNLVNLPEYDDDPLLEPSALAPLASLQLNGNYRRIMLTRLLWLSSNPDVSNDDEMRAYNRIINLLEGLG